MRYTSDEIEHKLWQLIDGSLPEDEEKELLEIVRTDPDLQQKLETMRRLDQLLDKEINQVADDQLVLRAVAMVKEESALASNSMKVMLSVIFILVLTGISGLFVTDGSGFGLNWDPNLSFDWNWASMFTHVPPLMAYSGLTILMALIFLMIYERRRKPI